MNPNDDAAYVALTARDARFDGRMFVGVTSTRIYCRPVCRVRIPMRKHCRFFDSAARAESQGFRPCLRCRPELAPGLSLMDSPHTLATHAAHRLERAARRGEALSMSTLAAALGVTSRHLHRIFIDAHGVGPLAYATTHRLLFAKHLLTDTRLPITHVALASGFGSVRRFNAAFQAHYRLTPGALRRDVDTPIDAQASNEAITLRLAYRPPYDVAGMLRFFGKRELKDVESVQPLLSTMARTLAIDGHRGWLGIQFLPNRHQIQVNVSRSLLPVLGQVIERARHTLDLNCEPDSIAGALRSVPGVPVAGLRLPGSFDGFESTIRIILGQQISVTAARTLAGRLVDRFGEPLATPWPTVQRTFPSALALSMSTDNALGSLGIVSSRLRAIKAVAQAVNDGRLVLDRSAPMATTLGTLQAISGLGEWTAQVVSMRVLGWPDAFPASDGAVLKALNLKRPADAAARALAWQPYRAYAVMQLWQSLETAP